MRRRSYGSKRVSRGYNRASLQMVLVQRDDLAGLDVASLARSHGLPVTEVERAVAAEADRRERGG